MLPSCLGEECVSHHDHCTIIVIIFIVQKAFFRMVILWAVITTYVSWFTDLDTACALVGWAVNLVSGE